jgi:hypothetical protein
MEGLLMDWNAEARGAANVASQGDFAEIERGALPWDRAGYCVVFGNDGYGDDARVRLTVEEVQTQLERAGIAVRSIATSDDDRTWAMLVEHTDYRWLTNLTWTCWRRVCAGQVDPMRQKPR